MSDIIKVGDKIKFLGRGAKTVESVRTEQVDGYIVQHLTFEPTHKAKPRKVFA